MANDFTEQQKPKDVKLYIFGIILDIYRKLPLRLRNIFETALFGLSVNNPINLSSILKERSYKRAFWNGFIFTFFFCFVVILFWTYKTQLLTGNDVTRIYFLNDFPNIINYTFICPLYVGLSCMLISIVLKGWTELKNIPKNYFSYEPKNQLLPFSILIVLVITLSTTLTINYINECINPSIYKKVGWYISTVTSDGHRILSGLGIYYAILTFVLMFISILALLAYFPLFSFCIEIGRSLKIKSNDRVISFDFLKKNLSYFTTSYLTAKWLVAIYMLNAFTWKWEKPEGSFNLILMGAILTLFGIFFISIPRYYIEFEWYKLKFRRYLVTKDESLLNYDDLRPFRTRLIVYFLDILIIGGFITSFWFS